MSDHRPLHELGTEDAGGVPALVFVLAVVCALAGVFFDVAAGAAVVLFVLAVALVAVERAAGGGR